LAADRFLRALHYFQENDRVNKMIEAIKKGKMSLIVKQINESGNSSFKFLQNIYSNKIRAESELVVALALTENFINEINSGACRVHGGGFEGSAMVFLLQKFISKFKEYILNFMPQSEVLKIKICSHNAIKLL